MQFPTNGDGQPWILQISQISLKTIMSQATSGQVGNSNWEITQPERISFCLVMGRGGTLTTEVL